jgi:hypothetical protein
VCNANRQIESLAERAKSLVSRVNNAADRGEHEYAHQHDVMRLSNQIAEIRNRLLRIEAELGMGPDSG